MKRLITLFFVLAFFTLPKDLNAQKYIESDYGDESYIKQNVSLVDALIRSIDENTYVREVKMVDFSGKLKLPVVFGIVDDVFKDDGKDFDKVAGDGIYTSLAIYKHSDRVPFISQDEDRSITENSISDPTFLFQPELQDYLKTYKTGYMPTGKKPGFGVSVSCQVHTCSCSGNCHCNACDVSWLPHGCFYFTDCTVEVSFGW